MWYFFVFIIFIASCLSPSGEYKHLDFVLGSDFFILIKHLGVGLGSKKAKGNNRDCVKLTSFCTAKGTINEQQNEKATLWNGEKKKLQTMYLKRS